MASNYLKQFSPKQIWEEEIESAHILIVKNIPLTMTEETLQNFLEIVTGEYLTSLYFYPTVTSIALALFQNAVIDLEDAQKRAASKKTVLELLPLGDIGGVVLSNISEQVGDDGLTFYFESRKCGSQGANVTDCKQLMDLKIAVIKMTASKEIFMKIVNKGDHQTAGVTFTVEPYYPTFHDPVFAAIQESNIQGVKSNMANKPTEITSPQTAVLPSARTFATLNQDIKPSRLETDSSDRKEGSQQRQIQDKIYLPQSGSGSENYGKFSESRDDNVVGGESTASFKSSDKLQFSSSSDNNGIVNKRKQILPDTNISSIPGIRKPLAYSNNQQKSAFGGLQIFPNECSPASAFSEGSKSSGQQPEYSSVPETHPHEKTKKNYRMVRKPYSSQRSLNPQLPVAPPLSRGQGGLEDQHKLDEKHEFEIMPMTLENIMLLIFDSFQKKCTFCKVIFDTRKYEVKFSGQTSDVQNAKMMMQKMLERKHEEISSSALKELYQNLLSLQKTKEAIRTMLKSERIYAFVIVKEDNHLHSYALNYHSAKKGLDLIEQSLFQATVTLREGQDKLLTGSDWTSLIQGIEQGNIIKIQQDTKMVEIGGLNQDAVKQAENEITTFLKNVKTLNTFKQVIKGAKARCFKTEMADGARDKVKSSGGRMKINDVPHQSEPDNFQIEVEILGSDSVIESFKRSLNSIWHERLKLNTLCPSEDELQLVLQALSTRGKDFIKSFEGRHHCFIDLILPAGKFGMKYAAPKRERGAESLIAQYAKSRGNSVQEHPFREKMRPGSNAKSNLERPLFKMLGSLPNVAISPVQSPQPRQAFVKQEIYDFAPPVYQRRPHSPQFRKLDFAAEPLHLPGDLSEYACERNLEGLEDKVADMKKEIKVSSVSIVVKQGDITKEQAYALLNIVPPSKDLSKESVISQSFVKAGGQELIMMYKNNLASEEDGFVLTEGTGSLRCDIVLHVMLKTNVDDTEREVRKVMTTCFQKCQMYGVTTLALPPLGCGRLYGYKEDSVVNAMLEETVKLASGSPGQMKKVTIVVYDQNLCQKFFKRLASLEIHATPMHHFSSLTDISQEKNVMKQQVLDARRDRYLSEDKEYSKNIPLLHSESSPVVLADKSKEHQPSSLEYQEKERMANTAFKLGASQESVVTVRVFTKDKHTCLECVKNLAKEMKENYLFKSEPVNKKHTLSPEDKKKIKGILSKYEASVQRKRVTKGVYILKGWKEEVYAAHNAILKVLFEASETSQKRKSQHKRPSSDFWKEKSFEQPETPEYWTMGNNVIEDLITKFLGTLSGKRSRIVDVDTATLREIVNLVNDTWQNRLVGQGSDAINLRHTNIQVMKVQMVENLDLFDLYFKKRQEIFKSLWQSKVESFPQLEKLKGCREGNIKTSRVGKCLTRETYQEINEYYFFHGTKVDKIDAICENGLDCRLGSEKAMLGSGIYGAESSTKADQYTDAKQARMPGVKKMFLMRMVLGNIFVCTDSNPHKYKRPPCKSCLKDDCANSNHGGSFDSVVGDMGKLFREFVVYEKNQCYPEYIITYTRV